MAVFQLLDYAFRTWNGTPFKMFIFNINNYYNNDKLVQTMVLYRSSVHSSILLMFVLPRPMVFVHSTQLDRIYTQWHIQMASLVHTKLFTVNKCKFWVHLYATTSIFRCILSSINPAKGCVDKNCMLQCLAFYESNH